MRCNRKKLAEILGRDVKTIDRMVENGMPYLNRPGEGRHWLFDSGAAFKWMTGASNDEKLKAARIKRLQAKAEMRWMELGQKLGFLVQIDEVMKKVEAGDAIVKSGLMAIPDRTMYLVAHENDPAAVHAILQKELDDVLVQLDKHWSERG